VSSKLTVKQRAFVDYYIETLNATEAARLAGYSENTASAIGFENLRKPKIKNKIDERLEELESERIADATEVMKYLSSVCRGETTEETVVVESTGDFTSKARIVEKRPSVRDRLKAAELLGKRYSLFTENIQINDIPVIVDDISEYQSEIKLGHSTEFF
jgi:phage terminase small subunit